jgi:hypothetical protein
VLFFYPLNVAKVERKGRSKTDADAVLQWFMGHGPEGIASEIASEIEKGTHLEAFFRDAPALNPARTQIRGVVCGVRVEDVPHPFMQEVRRLDKLIDELAKGRPLDQLLRR